MMTWTTEADLAMVKAVRLRTHFKMELPGSADGCGTGCERRGGIRDDSQFRSFGN